MKALLRRIRLILKDRRVRKYFTRFVSGTAAIIVFVTTYALVLPAITMESEALCGIPAHQHDDSCYEKVLVCDLPEDQDHQHSESCYENRLICGLEVHTHSVACYNEELLEDEETSAVAATQSFAGALSDTGENLNSFSDYTGQYEETENASDGDMQVFGNNEEHEDSENGEADGFSENANKNSLSEGSASDTETGLNENDENSENTANDSQAAFSEQNENVAVTGDSVDVAEDDTDAAAESDQTADFDRPVEGESGDTDTASTTSEKSANDNAAEEYTEDIGIGYSDDAGKNDITADETESGSSEGETVSENDSEEKSSETATGNTASEEIPAENASGTSTIEGSDLNTDVYIPALEPIDFNRVLTSSTGIYYYHADSETEETEEKAPANSVEITDWKPVDENTTLTPEDLIRVYLRYTIPAGQLNTTNAVARYRLPDDLVLSEEQVTAINNAENGISAQFMDYDTLEVKDADAHAKYLGVEAIEGTRTPDQSAEEYFGTLPGSETDSQEYISATVKVENIFDTSTVKEENEGDVEQQENTVEEIDGNENESEENRVWIGQDLIFTFSPYTIEKNQHEYDASGQPAKAGKKVEGWLTLDFNMGQVKWIETETVTDEEIIGTTDEAANNKDLNGETAANKNNSNSNKETVSDENINTDDSETGSEEKTYAEGQEEASTNEMASMEDASEASDGSKTSDTEEVSEKKETQAVARIIRTTTTINKEAEIIFVEEIPEDIENGIEPVKEISTTLRLKDEIVEENESEYQGSDSDHNADSNIDTSKDDTDNNKEKRDQAEAVEKEDNEKKDIDKKDTGNKEGGNKKEEPDVSQEKAEKTKTAKNMPEMTFDDSVAARRAELGSDSKNLDPLVNDTTIVVHVEADEGTFPEGTTMHLTSLSDENLDAISPAVEGAVDSRTRGFHAIDITFRDTEGNEIEPLKPIRVSMTSEAIKKAVEDKSTAPVLVHVENPAVAEKRGEGENTNNPQEDDDKKQDSEKTAEEETDEKQNASKDFSDEGDSPENTKPVESIGNDNTEEKEPFSLDISDPSALQATVIETNEDVGREESAGQEHDRNQDEENNRDTLSFESDAFSIYAVVYTVDFWYEIDGKEYKYSIRGGSAIGLKELLPIIGTVKDDPDTADNEIKQFVENIETAMFSDESLVKVAYIEEDITAGSLKEQMELEPEYSANLSEEEIAEMNAKEFKAIDWALISLKSFETEESLTVTMKNGEVFIVKVTDLIDPLGLEDRTYAIVNKNGNNWYSLQSVNNAIGIRSVNHAESNDVEYCDKDATAWLFEYDAATDSYYISDGYNSHGTGNYLRITGNGASLVAGLSNASTVKIEKDQNEDGVFYFTDGNGHYLINNNNTFSMGTTKTNAAKMHLCLPESSEAGASHKATLVSAADLQEGQSIVIYQRVLQPDDTYRYYAIDGDGNPQRVYNSSDSIYWKGDQVGQEIVDKNLEWKLTEARDDNGDLTGYFYFYNEKSNTYLAPKGNGTIVQSLSTYDGDMDDVSISLPGRKAGTYLSRIANWDYDRSVTSGLELVEVVEGEGENAARVPEVNQVDLLQSQEFFFAVRDPIVQGQLTEVDTVDSLSKGIHITMYDFSGDQGGSHTPRLEYMSEVMGDPSWAAGKYPVGIMSDTLATDNLNGNMEGYPNSAPWTYTASGWGWSYTYNYGGQSLGLIFEPPANAAHNYKVDKYEDANHLFIKNIYDSTGYYRYSAFENFAHFNTDTHEFQVYEQIGSPARSGENDYDNYYMNRGNFMPFNELDLNSPKVNKYQSDNDQELPSTDPRKGEDLYLLKDRDTKRNYYFGMIMEAKFQQYPGGLNDRGDPTRYDFNGDDDLWVYIDNVLILDIGGVHDAFKGYIDFKTGDVDVLPVNASVQPGTHTTIKRRFFEAGVFPDGKTPWPNTNPNNYDSYIVDGVDLVDEFFRDETFKDFSTHDFKMFYMERGAGASNLDLQFNLMVITEDAFRVTKEMPSTSTGNLVQDSYGDATFFYHAYTKDGEGDDNFVLCTKENYENRATYQDGSAVIWADNNTFIVKPGQTAIFPVTSGSTRYYVEEINPPGEPVVDMLQNYDVQNTDPLDGQPGNKQIETKKKSVHKRGEVIYKNKPHNNIVQELQIVKNLDGEMIKDEHGRLISDPQTKSPYFEYKVYLEDKNGRIQTYSLGPYYQIDKDGKYVYFIDGVRHTMDFHLEENAEDGTKTYYYGSGADQEVTAEPKLTEHTSENGSIADIRDGDTIYIWGLLEGTDFVVDERIDRAHMAQSPDELGKYVFVGTTVEDAYIRPDINVSYAQPDSIYAVPDYSEISFKEDRAAKGTIIPDHDAKVTVKNRADLSFEIGLKKDWLHKNGFSYSMLDQDNTKVKFTVKRYKLTDKFGTFTLTGKLTAAAGGSVPNNANPVYLIKQGDTIVKTVLYSSMTPVAGQTNTRQIDIDLPVGTYSVVCAGDLNGYDQTSTPLSVTPVTISVNSAEEQEQGQPETTTEPAAATITSEYTRQTGTLYIKKTLTGRYESDTQFNATYKITPKGKTEPVVATRTVTFSQLNNGTWTSDAIVLPVGDYTVTEVVNSTVPKNVKHSPESRSFNLTKDYVATTAFTGEYPTAKLITVTLHSGYSGNNASGWNQNNDRTKTYTNQFAAGSTIRVKVAFPYCAHWSGVYDYDTTSNFNSQNHGTFTAYNNSANQPNISWTKDEWLEFSIPDEAESFDVYFKSRCADSGWSPVILDIQEVLSNGSKSQAKSLRSALRAGEPSDDTLINILNIPNEEVNPDTLPVLSPPDDVNKKYVLDTSWNMLVEMGRGGQDRIGYIQTVTWAGSPSPDVITGELDQDAWEVLLKHKSIVKKDEDGYPYYYYIESVDEIQVPKGTTPSIDLAYEANPDIEGDTDKTLMTSYLDPQTLSVTNDYLPIGAVKIAKEVRVNDELLTNETPADIKELTNGIYTFEIWNADGTSRVTTKADGSPIGTLTINVTDGIPDPDPIIVEGLLVGDYVLKETGSTNSGMIVDKIRTAGYDETLGGIPFTVAVADVAEVEVKTFVNDYKTTELTVKKTWSDIETNNHSNDIVLYSLYRTPHSGSVEYTPERVITADGYTGELSSQGNNWQESIINLPVNGLYTPSSDNPEHKIPVTYTYFVSENAFDGYTSQVSFVQDANGHYAYTIANEPYKPFYEETDLKIKKEWKNLENELCNDDHNSDNISFRMTAKKYPAKVRYVYEGNEISVNVYPVKINFYRGPGDPNNSHVEDCVFDHSEMVYVTEGGSVTIHTEAGNGSHSLEADGFSAAENPPSYGVISKDYHLGPIREAHNVTFYARYNDTWGDEPGTNVWSYSITTVNGMTFEDEKELKRYIDVTGAPVSSAPYDYIMSVDRTTEPAAPVFVNIGDTIGARSSTELWEGQISRLPFLEQDENNNNTFYLYVYDITEAKAGTETVNINNPPEGYNGQTSLYYVKWEMDQNGNWLLTNKEKPRVEVDVSKTWADPQDLPENASVTVLLSATSGGESFDLTSLGIEVEQEISRSSTDSDHPGVWYYKWTNLPKTDSAGETITYSVTEQMIVLDETSLSVTDSQITPDTPNSDYSFHLKNQIPPVEVKARKNWSQETLPENTSVVLKLNASVPGFDGDIFQEPEFENIGERERTLTGTDATNSEAWTAVWSNLPRYYEGEKIIYSAEETEIIVGNKKIWSSEDGGVNPLLIGMDETDPLYVAVFTNKLPRKSVEAEKEWLNAAGGKITHFDLKHGETVTFGVFANNAAEPVTTVELTGTEAVEEPADGNIPVGYESEAWKAVFKNLPVYDEQGLEITYTIKETVGFVDYTNLNPEGVHNEETITNRRTEATENIPAHKNMVDGEVPVTGTFQFTLEANATTKSTYGPMPSRAKPEEITAHKMTISNEGSDIDFGSIIYKLADWENGDAVEGVGNENKRKFTYTVKEIDSSADGVTYDGTEFQATVILTFNRAEGTLTAEWGFSSTPEGKNAIVFTNEERVTILASKIWKNGADDITSTIENAEVIFELQESTDDGVNWNPVEKDADGTDVANNPVRMFVTNAADAQVWNTQWSNLKKYRIEEEVSRHIQYRVVETYARYQSEELVKESDPDDDKPNQTVVFVQNQNIGTAPAIVNSLPTVDIEVNKAWRIGSGSNGWPDDIDKVVVELQQSIGGSEAAALEPAKTAEITEANWTLTEEAIADIEDEQEKAQAEEELAKRFFKNLPKYDNSGNLITYSVVETQVGEQQTSETEFTVFYSPQTTSTGGLITVTNAKDKPSSFIKKWIGFDQDITNPQVWPQREKEGGGKEDVPITITVTRRLRYAETPEGTPVDHVVQGDDFTYTFTVNSSGIVESADEPAGDPNSEPGNTGTNGGPYPITVTMTDNAYTITLESLDMGGTDGTHGGEWIYYYHETMVKGYLPPGYQKTTDQEPIYSDSEEYATDEGGQIFNIIQTYVLPNSGGSGTYRFRILGSLLIMLAGAGFIIMMYKRRNVA